MRRFFRTMEEHRDILNTRSSDLVISMPARFGGDKRHRTEQAPGGPPHKLGRLPAILVRFQRVNACATQIGVDRTEFVRESMFARAEGAADPFERAQTLKTHARFVPVQYSNREAAHEHPLHPHSPVRRLLAKKGVQGSRDYQKID